MTSLRVCAVIAAWWGMSVSSAWAQAASAPVPIAVVESEAAGDVDGAHVDAAVLPRPVAVASEIPPQRPTPRPMGLDRLVLYALLGDVVGAGLGAIVATLIGLASCHGGEGWVSGFTCGAGIGYAASMGALVGAAVGAPISVAAVGGRRHLDGDGWAGLGGSMLALGAGAAVLALVQATTDQPTLATGLGAIVAVALGLVLGPVFYDLGRPARSGPHVALRGLGLSLAW